MKIKLRININVWGENYIKTFLNYSLPSFLAGNYQDLMDPNIDAAFWICSLKKNFSYFDQFDSFRKLKQMMPVEMFDIQSFYNDNNYDVYIQCLRLVVEKAYKINAPLMFPMPDQIFSHGLIQQVVKSIEEKKRCIVLPTPRLERNSVIKHLDSLPHFKDIGITQKQLTRLAIQTFHNLTKKLIWDETHIMSWPSQLIWKLDDNAYLFKCFHIHPIFIWPEKAFIPDGMTDANLIADCISSFEKIEFIDYSNKLTICELSDPLPLHTTKKKTKKISYWARTYCNAFHLKAFCFDLIYDTHSKDSQRYHLKLKEIKNLERKIITKTNNPGFSDWFVWFFYFLTDSGSSFTFRFKIIIKAILKKISPSFRKRWSRFLDEQDF